VPHLLVLEEFVEAFLLDLRQELVLLDQLQEHQLVRLLGRHLDLCCPYFKITSLGLSRKDQRSLSFKISSIYSTTYCAVNTICEKIDIYEKNHCFNNRFARAFAYYIGFRMDYFKSAVSTLFRNCNFAGSDIPVFYRVNL
jgi:hypothetical protein